MIATKLYLDARQSKDGAPAPLKISIYYRRQVAYISTGFKILPSAWDPVSLTTKDKATMLAISRFKLKIDTLLLDLLESGKLDGLDASGVRNLVKRELNPADEAAARFLECMARFASSRPKQRTRDIYQATIARIRAFDRRADELTFDDVTYGWLDRFDSFLAQTSPKRNARNIHFRNIRATFRDAMKKKITMCYPFLEFEIRPEQTAKRDLSVEQLRALFDAKVKPWQQKYVDFFKMSFMLIGMNTEDLLHATGFNGDRLEYNRAKTNKPYSIKVEPECRDLIEKYRGKKYLLNILDTYASTAHWTSKVDNELKEICKDIGLPAISMYWARHSWSTICSDLDIPKETNTAAMGHSSKSVTDIYINFDRNKIDQANRKVLDFVLYDKKPTDMYDLMMQLNDKITNLNQVQTNRQNVPIS